MPGQSLIIAVGAAIVGNNVGCLQNIQKCLSTALGEWVAMTFTNKLNNERL